MVNKGEDMQELSVAIIAKNEEVMIAKMLESIQDADEIIVCDTGSEDKTIEIAKQYTDNVFTDFIWCDDFAAARNHAISKCTKQWILTIDCDESLDAGHMNLIKERIQTDTHKTIGVKMYSGNTHFYSPRIYKNDKTIFWEGLWHNCLNVVEQNETDIRINYKYSPAHAKDPKRGMRLGERAIKNHPTSARYHFYYGRELMYEKRWQEAIDIFNKYYTLSPWPVEEAYAHYLHAQCLNNLGDWKAAKKQCWICIEFNPNFKAIWYFLASISGPGSAKFYTKCGDMATNENVLFAD